jgi:STE24 endopeptidase
MPDDEIRSAGPPDESSPAGPPAGGAPDAPAVPPQDDERARRYQSTHRRVQLADFLLGWAWLGALLFLGWSAALRDLGWNWTGHYSLALSVYLLLILGIGKLIGLPLDYYSGYVVEHRYGLSRQTLAGWLRDNVKGFVLGAALGLVGVQLIYWLIRVQPDWWWLIAWGAFLVFVILMANLAPVLLFPLFYKFKPLEDEDLKQRLLRLSERAGARIRGVFEWKLSEKSRKANAALAGWGNTRRIILSDTLLQHYTKEEIEAILAHELAHHVHRDIPKSLALQAGISLLGFWLADAALRAFTPRFGFDGLADFANLPLLAFVSGVLSLALLPVVNGISRHFERRADEYALRAIPSVGPFISSMEKLAGQNLAERRPNRVIEVVFHSHPAIGRRIERARQFAASHPDRTA